MNTSVTPTRFMQFAQSVWLPLVVYVCLSGLYLWVVPLGESPDEPGHLQCIDQVARLNRLPIVDPVPTGDHWADRTRIISGGLCYHMPLYYLITGGIQKGLTAVSATPLPIPFPPNNPAFYVSEVNFFDHTDHQTEPVNIWGLRLFSIILGGFLIYSTWRISLVIWPEQPWIATLSALILAVWPQFLFAYRAITNDVLAVALAVGVLVFLLKGQTPTDLIWAGVLSALAVLTKLSVGFTIGAVIAVCVLECWWHREHWQPYARAGLICLGIWIITAILLWVHPILQQHLVYSSLTGAIYPRVWTWAYWQDVATLTFSSGWGRFGWMNLELPIAHIWVWWGLVGITAVISIRQLVTQQPRQFLVLAVWFIGVFVTYIRINVTLFQPQFRFLFPLLPILSILIAGGINQILPKRWGFTLPILLVAYNCWVIIYIYPVYW